jgi:cytochrome o ubiquinol oxidase operon protein cyoD
MEKKPVESISKSKAQPASTTTYVIGFVLAVILTLVAYAIVVNHWLSGAWLIGAIMSLAAVQLLVQLVFFLHLGKEKGSRWNVASFYFMLLILVVIVGGSLWIMNGLNYNMTMSSKQMDEYMLKESAKGF